jgi:hypothetical protein
MSVDIVNLQFQRRTDTDNEDSGLVAPDFTLFLQCQVPDCPFDHLSVLFTAEYKTYAHRTTLARALEKRVISLQLGKLKKSVEVKGPRTQKSSGNGSVSTYMQGRVIRS